MKYCIDTTCAVWDAICAIFIDNEVHVGILLIIYILSTYLCLKVSVWGEEGCAHFIYRYNGNHTFRYSIVYIYVILYPKFSRVISNRTLRYGIVGSYNS